MWMMTFEPLHCFIQSGSPNQLGSLGGASVALRCLQGRNQLHLPEEINQWINQHVFMLGLNFMYCFIFSLCGVLEDTQGPEP